MQCPACHASIPLTIPRCPHCGATITLNMAAPAASARDWQRAMLEEELGARYEIIDLIGRGGMGVVYRARHRQLGNLVAIKVPAPDASLSPETRARFRDEAQIAANLTHPNILKLHDWGEVDGFAYYIMECVNGKSLRECLQREGRLPSDRVRRIVAELAGALDYAHRHKVIHRDIKPENILIEDESGRPILCDFGIAKAQDRDGGRTLPDARIGSVLYMSPEQACGEKWLDGRSDLYSLGVVAFEMLTGRVPFELPPQASIHAVLWKHVNDPPPSLESLAPDVPDDLAAAIKRCLAKHPDDRWPDGKSLREALVLEDTDEDAVPRDVGELLPGLGIFAAVWGVAWGLMAVHEYRAGGDAAIFALIALLVPVGFLLNAWSAWQKGFRARLIFRVGFWPPKWWGMWWPGPWRRPGDVWFRLPPIIRLVRTSLTSVLVGLPALAYAARVTGATGGSAGARALWVDVAELGLIALTGAIVAGGTWWGRRRGLKWDELVRLLIGAPVGAAFWARPHIARLLAPAALSVNGRRVAEPQTIHEYERAIRDLARHLGRAERGEGARAVETARKIVERIEALNAEIASLRRDLAALGVQGLERRLDDLRKSSDHEPDYRREFREKLTDQLVLARRLSARLDEALTHHSRLGDRLRQIWLQLAVLDAQPSSDTVAGRQSSERIRALCREAEEEAVPAGSSSAAEDR